jgi:hypothetical protein
MDMELISLKIFMILSYLYLFYYHADHLFGQPRLWFFKNQTV